MKTEHPRPEQDVSEGASININTCVRVCRQAHSACRHVRLCVRSNWKCFWIKRSCLHGNLERLSCVNSRSEWRRLMWTLTVCCRHPERFTPSVSRTEFSLLFSAVILVSTLTRRRHALTAQRRGFVYSVRRVDTARRGGVCFQSWSWLILFAVFTDISVVKRGWMEGAFWTALL